MPRAQLHDEDDDDFIAGTSQTHGEPNDDVDVKPRADDDDDDIKVSVVDDTPPEDRGRKPKATKEDKEDAEVLDYSQKVKKRFGELKHQYHDERRAKEQALRERDELEKIARTAYERAKALESQLTFGEASYATEVTEKAKLRVTNAKNKHRAAYESGDPDAIADATAELAAASQEEVSAKQWAAQADRKAKSALQQDESDVDSQPLTRQQPAPRVDKRANAWVDDNSDWFRKDPEMTSVAFGVHEKLVRSGIDPDADADEYYEKLDAAMRRHFPDYEWDDNLDDEDDAPAKSKATSRRKSKPSQTVSGVTRVSSGNPQKVTLTKTQVAIAERLGIPLKAYARELLRMKDEG